MYNMKFNDTSIQYVEKIIILFMKIKYLVQNVKNI